MTEARPIAAFAACCAMVFAFSFAFLIMGIVPMPLFWYHPLEHAWILELRPQTLAIDFYGRTFYATLVAAPAFFIGRALGRRRTDAKPDVLWLWLAWALAFTALAMCLLGYKLWPRPAQPLPIPAWYQPR